MVRLVSKMLWALIKKCKVVFLALVFVSSLGVLMGTSFLSTYVNFKYDTDAFINNYGLPDVTLTLDNPVSQVDLENVLQNLPNKDKIKLSYRFEYYLNADVNGSSVTLDTITVSNDSFAKLYEHESIPNEPLPTINVKLHKAFADNNKLKTGDHFKIGIKMQGYTYMSDAVVQAIVSSPEAILYTFGGKISVDQYDFGYAFISPSDFEKVLPPTLLSYKDQIIVKTDLNHEMVRKDIETILENNNINVWESFTREQSPNFIYVQNLYSQLQIISFVVPLIFLSITLILIFLFLFQIIRGFMHEIGIMQAIGIQKKKILGLMVAFSMSIGIVSSIIGISTSFPVTNFIAGMYATNYHIPTVSPLPNGYIAIIVSLVIIVLGMIASMTTMFMIRKITPKDAIVNNASQYKPLPEKVNRLIEKRSINFKINVNNIHKNLLRFIVSVVTIVFSYSIIFSATHFYCGNEYCSTQLAERFKYDAEIYSLDLISATDQPRRDNFVNTVKGLKSVQKSQEMIYTFVTLSFNNQSENVTLGGLQMNHSMVNIPDERGTGTCDIKPDEIVIEYEIAQRFNIHVNDQVKINNYPIKVNAISKQLISKKNYVEYNTFLKKVKPDNLVDVVTINSSNRDNLLQDLNNARINSHIIFFDKYLDSTTGGIRSTQIACIGIVGFAFIVGFLVIFIMNQENLNAQKRKLSIMCSLGFKKKKITKIILEQQLINVIIGLAIGIPFAVAFANILIKLGSTRTVTNIFLNYWWIYLLSILCIVIYVAVVQLTSYLMIKKWNISDNIKARE